MAPSENDEQPRPTIDRKTAQRVISQTYWSHDPFADPDSDNARLAAIATEFVGLFYQNLLQKHCRVAMGVEIEGKFESRYRDALEEAIHHINDNLEYTALENTRRNGIYRAYRDDKEIEITTRPLKPLETIAYVKSIKKILATSTEEFDDAAQQAAPESDDTVTRSRSAQRFSNITAAKKFRFGSIPDENSANPEIALYGEHINISLHRTNSDVSSHSFNLATHNVMNGKIADILETAFAYCTSADQLLLYSQEASCKRAEKYYRPFDPSPNTFLHNSRMEGKIDKGNQLSDDEAARVEWRVPDSASDIHLTSLAAMAVIYACVNAINKKCGTNSLPEKEPIYSNASLLNALQQYVPMPATAAMNQQNRIAQFKEHSVVLRMMHNLVSEMPETERPRLYKLIEEFQTAAIQQSEQQFAPKNPDATKRTR